jgi:hypothetical protein
MALSDCSKVPPQILSTHNIPIVTYSKAQEAQAAAELKSLPANSELGQMITDYSKERDALRGTSPSLP